MGVNTTVRLGYTVSLPDFGEQGYLPPGEHLATWQDLQDRFGESPHRRRLLRSLATVVDALRQRGVSNIWIDGSFVTDESRPRDIDVIYEAPPEANPGKWGLYAPANRHRLKKLERIDLLKYPSPQQRPLSPGTFITILEFMKKDRSGVEKGIVRLDLEDDE